MREMLRTERQAKEAAETGLVAAQQHALGLERESSRDVNRCRGGGREKKEIQLEEAEASHALGGVGVGGTWG